MTAYSFQKQFVEAVENGIDLVEGRALRHADVRPKTTTIRADRKDERVQPVGGKVQCYYAMRTKQCRFLGEVTARAVIRVEMKELGVGRLATFDGMNPAGLVNRVASGDGFSSPGVMFEWFEKTHGMPFKGWLIDWSPVPIVMKDVKSGEKAEGEAS